MQDFDLQLKFRKDAASKVANVIFHNKGKQIMEVRRVDLVEAQGIEPSG